MCIGTITRYGRELGSVGVLRAFVKPQPSRLPKPDSRPAQIQKPSMGARPVLDRAAAVYLGMLDRLPRSRRGGTRKWSVQIREQLCRLFDRQLE